MTDDDDPTNISPRVYLPIVVGAILVAVIAAWVVLFVMEVWTCRKNDVQSGSQVIDSSFNDLSNLTEP